MRALPKGINRITKKLASGEVLTYYYAWKGGPRLKGEPGSPEFFASYEEAIQGTRRVPKDDLRSLIDRYLDSRAYIDLADATKELYQYHIKLILPEFGSLPISALEDRRVRGQFLEWRDRFATRSVRQADLAFRTLARIISWGFDRGIAPANPCQRAGKLYKADRRDIVWTAEQEEAFLNSAPKHLQLAFLLALWTGQRQKDLRELTWGQYDGTFIRIRRQSKTGAMVAIPVARVLKKALDEARASIPEMSDDEVRRRTILRTQRGDRPWTEDGFRGSWAQAREKAGISGVTFHDLRGTAVTRLADAGCTVPEIATITGHSLSHVHSVLELYFKRDPALAVRAIQKLERRARRPTGRPTSSQPRRNADKRGRKKPGKSAR